MAGPQRNLLLIIWQNFVSSLKPRQMRGNKMGKDYLGNAYFEIPAKQRAAGHRKPSRWFEPAVGTDFQNELPAEWESWLRGRRSEPPTEEEIASNVALMKLKRENAARLEAERRAAGGALPAAPPAPDTVHSYPKYDDYEYGGKPKH